MTTLPPPPPAQLDYAASPGWRSRKSARRAALVAVLLLAGMASVKWLGPAWDRVRLVYYQGRCLEHVDPRGVVAYDGGLAQPAGATDWDRFYERFSPPGGKQQALVFLHELRHRSGARRLVAVQASDGAELPWGTGVLRSAGLTSTVIEPGGLWGGPRLAGTSAWTVPLNWMSGDRMKLYAGQPDPADPTHFSMAYECAERRGTIDGWLLADDSVFFELRAPEHTVTSAQP